MIRVGTVFTGIGAIEQALKRLGLEHTIVFGCDNGDVELKLLPKSDQKRFELLKKAEKKGALTDAELAELSNYRQTEANLIEEIRSNITTLPSKDAKREFVESIYKKHSSQQNYVKQSYFANYDIDPKDFHLDICFFDGSDYNGKVDLLVGGSPCQSFSTVGKQLGFEDTRGTLFYEFARVVKETSPKIFLFENVRGLLNHDKGRTWQVMYDIFEELGYDVKFRVLNSCNYGIPQHRERIFCLGFKKATKFEYPAPIELEYKMYDFLEDYIDTKYFLKEKGVKFVTSHKNRDKSYTQINGDIQLCQKRNQQFNWHGDFVYHPDSELTPTDESFDEFVFDVKDVEEKYYLSEKVAKYVLAGGTKNFKTSTETDLDIARPLLQSMHKMHRAGVDNYVTHKGRIRKLTPRECLRLMGFKDTFKIVVSDTAIYQQAGNSIVVDVLIALLKQLDVTKYGV